MKQGPFKVKKTSWSYVSEGYALSLEGKYAKALAVYEEGLKLDPKHFRLNYYAGNALYEMEMYLQALPFYLKARETTPSSKNVHIKIANSLRNLELYDEALKYYSKILELDENCAQTYLDKAFCLGFCGKKTDAKATYEKAKLLNPEFKYYDALFSELTGLLSED